MLYKDSFCEWKYKEILKLWSIILKLGGGRRFTFLNVGEILGAE